jgi:hypothetical protein
MAVPAQPLEVVGPRRRRRLHQLAVSGVLVAGAVARAYSVTLLCLVVAVVAFAVGRMRDAPALPVRLDETGLPSGHHGLPVGRRADRQRDPADQLQLAGLCRGRQLPVRRYPKPVEQRPDDPMECDRRGGNSPGG